MSAAYCNRRFLDIVDRRPPFLVLALSKNGRHRKTLEEISERTGISLRSMQRLAHAITWRKLDAETIDEFTTACAVNILCMTKFAIYFAKVKDRKTKRPLRHLTTFQYNQFEKDCVRWQAMMARRKIPTSEAPQRQNQSS